MKSSVPFQILLYYNGWYIIVFFSIDIGSLVYKGILLPYPKGVLTSDIIFLVILTCLLFIQIYSGYKGNQLEDNIWITLFILMSFPVLGGALYFLLWQTYILWIEAITASVEIGFLAIEVTFAFLTFATAPRTKKRQQSKLSEAIAN